MLPLTFPLILLALLIITLFSNVTEGMHFYISPSAQKCFHEDLPRNTLVVGKYRIEQFSDNGGIAGGGGGGEYTENPTLGVRITVDQLSPSSGSGSSGSGSSGSGGGSAGVRIKDIKGPSSGRFSFTSSSPSSSSSSSSGKTGSSSSSSSGDHLICLSTNETGWFASKEMARVHFDLVIGEFAYDSSLLPESVDSQSTADSKDSKTAGDLKKKKSGKVNDLVQKVKNLNHHLTDIRNEHILQSDKERMFRDASEHANSLSLWLGMGQVCVMAVVCLWQTRYLKRFFEHKKLV